MIDKTPIRLVLADDQTLVRGALAALLGMEDDLETVSYTHLTLPTKRIV